MTKKPPNRETEPFDEKGLRLGHRLVKEKDEEGVKAWIAAGGEVDSLDRQSNTPLHYATWAKNASMAKLLIEAKADPNWPNAHKKQTPFHHAVNVGCPVLIEMLHHAGANWLAQDIDELTPLHLFAAPKGQGVRRSEKWKSALAETLGFLAPPHLWGEPYADGWDTTLADHLMQEHGWRAMEEIQQARVERSERELDASLPTPVKPVTTRQRF